MNATTARLLWAPLLVTGIAVQSSALQQASQQQSGVPPMPVDVSLHDLGPLYAADSPTLEPPAAEASGLPPTPVGIFTVFGPQEFTRLPGSPTVEEVAFSVFNPNTIFTLEFFNGGFSDDLYEPISSAVIMLNGVQVVGPGQVQKTVAYQAVPVEPGFSNMLAVELRGKPIGALVGLRIIGVDEEPPTIKATVTPPPNAAGWHNTDVTVSFECADVISGVASCSSSVVVTTEGAGQVVTGTAIDNAGNTASVSVTLNIDKTPPTIAAMPSPIANAAGWNNTNVAVSFDCQDALSGVASCTAPISVATEGAGQVIGGIAVDVAGNAAMTSATLNIDKTPPTITPLPSPVANGAGWNNTNVTVGFFCQDALSGVASCTDPILVTTEAAGLVVGGTAVDVAGNTTNASTTLNIDKTPPTIAAVPSPTANSAGWNRTSVTVSFNCQDTLSGVVSCTSPISFTTEGAGQVASGTAVDLAGNTATASATLNIDTTPPTISALASPAANANGWNNTNVAVTFDCQDALSGVFFCPAPVTFTTEGAGQVAVGTAVDVAGNTATTAAVANIDKTSPTIAFDSPVPVPGGSTNRRPTFTTSYSDDRSGLNLSSYLLLVNSVNVTSSTTVGSLSATYTPSSDLPLGANSGAASITDRAGNPASATVNFTLIEEPGGGGDPVELPSGNFIYELTHHDIRVPDDGLPLELLFTYRVQEAYDGCFGSGWHSTLTSTAIVDYVGGTEPVVTLREGNGNRRRCLLDENGNFVDPKVAYRRLVRNVDGSYDLMHKSGLVHRYDPSGRITSFELPGRGSVQVAYGASGAIRSATSASGHTITFTARSDGKISTVSDPMVGDYEYAYDPEGRMASVTDPLGNLTRYEYDAAGNLARVILPNGVTLLENVYDARGRVVSQTLPQGTIRFLYDGPSQIRLVDPRGTTTFELHESGLPSLITYYDGRTASRRWDSRLNLVEYTDSTGTAYFAYDSASRLTRVTMSNGESYAFGYDPTSERLTSVADMVVPNGKATIRYDDLRGVIEVTDVRGRTETFPADAYGLLRTWQKALGAVFPFTSRYQLRP